MDNDELYALLKEVSTTRQNFIKEIRSLNLKNAQSSSGNSLILEAIFDNLSDLAKMIRSKTENISVAEACALGEFETLKQLVSNDKTSVNSWTVDGFTPLSLACAFSGSTEMIEFLLKNGAEVNTVTKNKFIKVAPVHASMFGGRNDILGILLKNGANPNLDQENKTSYPLHEAVGRKDIEALKLLLQYGADISNKTKDGKTAFDLAVEMKFVKAQKLLR